MSSEPSSPGGPLPGSSDDVAEAGQAPLFASGSRDDGLGDLVIDRDLIPNPAKSGARPAGKGTADFLPAIDIAPSSPPSPTGESGDDEPASGMSWPVVLLASYASAVTLALAWVLLTRPARGPYEPSAASTPTPPRASAGPDVAESVGRKVEPPAAIPDDRMASFGEPLRLGSLEITPLEAKRQPVTLRRIDLAGRATEKRGLPNTIVLRLRLHNTSSDQAFAPFDPAFVRQRGQEDLDCFAESPGGERIYPYPLAIESELKIAGQDFDELRPGESRDVLLATAPAVGSVDLAALSWRIRLRTGLDRVETIGVSPASGRPSKSK